MRIFMKHNTIWGGHVLVMAISNSHVNDHPISTRKSQESFGIYRLTLGMVAVLYF
jgi:hypothetical protein